MPLTMHGPTLMSYDSIHGHDSSSFPDDTMLRAQACLEVSKSRRQHPQCASEDTTTTEYSENFMDAVQAPPSSCQSTPPPVSRVQSRASARLT